MAILYIGAGINHFWHPGFYLKVMPGWLPWHRPLVYVSGVVEIVLGLLVVPVATRPFAAWAIIAMLVVFQACVHLPMLVGYYPMGGAYFWLSAARFAAQFLLVYWAWKVAVSEAGP